MENLRFTSGSFVAPWPVAQKMAIKGLEFAALRQLIRITELLYGEGGRLSNLLLRDVVIHLYLHKVLAWLQAGKG
jgi:hypothetical protein